MGPFSLWNHFWFRPSPLLDLAVCRIVIVGYQLGYILYRPWIDFLRDHAALPDSLYDPLPVLHVLIAPFGWHARPSLPVLEIAYWLAVTTGLLALIGMRTNLSLALFTLTNVLIQSYIYSFGEMHHPEAVMMIALAVLTLSPSGAVLSVDDWRRRAASAISRQRFESFSLTGGTSPFARWPLLLLACVLALIYASAARWKLIDGLEWMNGYTLRYYLLQDGLRWDVPLGVWFSQHHTFVWLLSWVSILFEAGFFLVLFAPWLAWILIPVGIGFHTGIYLTMKAPFFSFMIIYVVLVPWERLFTALSRYSSLPKVAVFFDGECPLCIRAATQVQYLDWFRRVTFTEIGGDAPEMIARSADGSTHRGFFAFRRLLWCLPLSWPLLPLAYFPFVSIVGPAVYRFIAARRPKFQHCTAETCAKAQ